MAPRRNLDETLRRSYKQNSNAAASARAEKQAKPSRAEADGDVLMGGYRIPTVISSKGAVQHKQDRYAPREANKEGHKRPGGRWDGYREDRRPTSTDRYGEAGHKEDRFLVQGGYDHRVHDTSSRRDRHAREYQMRVNSSRIRYERDRNRYRSSNPPGDYYVPSRYQSFTPISREDNSYRYSRSSSNQFSNHQNPTTYPRRGGGGPRYSLERSTSYHQSSGSNWGSHPPSRNQEAGGRYYDQERARSDHQWRLRIRNEDHARTMSEFDLGGTFEEAMKGIAAHAAKFLRNANRRDREVVQTAVWKAYGDSIASLGNRYTMRRIEDEPNEWVSARGITDYRGDNQITGANHVLALRDRQAANGSHQSISSAAVRRGRALEEYRQANKDYEKSWEVLFGVGSYSLSGSKPDSEDSSGAYPRTGRNGNSYGGEDSHSYPYRSSSRLSERSSHRLMRESLGDKQAPVRGRSQSPGSDSTITARTMQKQIPRPRMPRDRPFPIYSQDPNDPTKFLNVPRPRVREQWHIPADYYNGAAWAEHRKAQLETGAIPAFYPDRWFSGQSYGNAKNGAKRIQVANKNREKPEEIIGRDCYLQSPATGSLDDAASVSGSVVNGFGAIRLSSVPRSIYGDSRAGSELPEDFDIYASEEQLNVSNNTQPPIEAAEQQITWITGGNSSSEDEGPATPRLTPLPPAPVYTHLGAAFSRSGDPLAVQGGDEICQRSREATPSICLADLIQYDSSKVQSLLGHGGSNDKLIDFLSSPPSTPDAIRSGETTPTYSSQTPHQSHRRNDPSLISAPTEPRADRALREDWENSFASSQDSGPTIASPRNGKSLLLARVATGQVTPKSRPSKAASGGEILAHILRSDEDAEDDLDFMGVDWFSK